MSLISCTGNEASSSLTAKEIAIRAASTYQNAIKEVSANLMAKNTIEPKTLEGIYNRTREQLLKDAKLAKDLPRAKQESYGMLYNKLAYEDLDSSMLIIIRYKDSLKTIDPIDLHVLQLEEFLGVSAYGDLEMLKRIFPKEYNRIFSK